MSTWIYDPSVPYSKRKYYMNYDVLIANMKRKQERQEAALKETEDHIKALENLKAGSEALKKKG